MKRNISKLFDETTETFPDTFNSLDKISIEEGIKKMISDQEKIFKIFSFRITQERTNLKNCIF